MTKLLYIPTNQFIIFYTSPFSPTLNTINMEELYSFNGVVEKEINFILDGVNNSFNYYEKNWLIKKNNIKLPLLREELEVIYD